MAYRRLVPKADVSRCSKTSAQKLGLLDHLVGQCEKLRRNFEADRPGGVEVEDQLEFGRLHDRQDGWLLALENAAHISAGLLIQLRKVRPIAHQPSGLGKVTCGIDRWYRVARRQRDDLHTPTDKNRVDTDQQCAAGLLREVCEGRIDLATGTGAKDFDRKSKRRSIRLQVFDLDLGIRSIRVDKRDKAV